VSDTSILDFLGHAGIDTDEAVNSLPYDFAFSLGLNDSKCLRFRGNLDRRWQGLDLTLRLLPGRIRTLKELGLPEYLYELMDLRQGLVLICGSTGSGKSTTMASLIEYVNQNHGKKIVSIEDPIEYILEEKKSIVSQRQISPDSSFLPHLKAALRQRPDIIVVGEVRDTDTASVLLQAAETGHLVISTLHTVSTQQTLMRIRDMLPADMKNGVLTVLSNILRAVVVQRLLKNYKQRVMAAYEICMVDTSIQQAIRGDKFHQIPNYMQYKRSVSGSVTMNEILKEFVDKGDITLEEALRFSYDPEDFR
jgi:twitching motility protein PilT